MFLGGFPMRGRETKDFFAHVEFLLFLFPGMLTDFRSF